MKFLFRLLAWLDLPANHALGALLGRLYYRLSPTWRRLAHENLRSSGLCGGDEALELLARENAQEVGKCATELAWALFRSPADVEARVHATHGWEAVAALHERKRPLLFVTPHLGAFDIAGRWLWTRVPILAMYRPHKREWLDRILREGRNRGAAPDGTNVAPATLAGVRMLLRHLRRGGGCIILPDQVPGNGDGEWADFFGRPAYTMTLVARLQESSDAAVVFCFAERLAHGEGYHLHFRVLDEPLPADRALAARRINAEIERLVRSCPTQFLWGYNRHKRPAGAPAAPAAAAP